MATHTPAGRGRDRAHAGPDGGPPSGTPDRVDRALRTAVRPDYGGAWIGAVVPSLLTDPADGPLPEPAGRAARHALLVLDGLGWSDLERHRHLAPTLAGMVGGPVTAAVPATTAVGLTCISTGLTPAEHGLLGLRTRVGGVVLNALRWQARGGRPPEPADVQPHPPFLGHRVPVLTRAELTGTGFSVAHLRGAELEGWRVTSTLVTRTLRRLRDGDRFVHAYYDGVDKVAHEHGVDGELFAAEVAFADRMVAELLEGLPDDAALVVTADHGQVGAGPEHGVPLDADVLDLAADVAGEGRFRTLRARGGAGDELVAACRERHGEHAWVLQRDELFDDGWLGGPAPRHVRERVGDVALAAQGRTVVIDPDEPGEALMRSQHGSLTATELQVPLLAGP